MLAKCFSRLTLTQCCVPTIYTLWRGYAAQAQVHAIYCRYIWWCTYIHTYRYVRVYVCMQVHIYLDNVPMDSLSRTRLHTHTHTHGSVHVKSHFRLYACLCLACWCLPVLNKNDKKSTLVICSICRGVHNWTSESFNVSGVAK